mmetsp:Transcript_45155/g.78868  ORF Transcript_45155/g.78868 Transcript_45155/m.78868 type:complete len:238 (-) Transcript_45155:688-1401(-)
MIAPHRAGAVVVTAPHRRVVVDEHVLVVLCARHHHRRGTLDYPTFAVILYVRLGLAQSQTRIHRGRSAAIAVLGEQGSLLGLLELLFLLCELPLGQLGLRRVAHHVDVLSASLHLPAKQLVLSEFDRIAGVPDEVVAREGEVLGVLIWQRVRAHRTGLGIVEGTVQRQIAQVLGCVLAQTQVADGLSHSIAADASLRSHRSLKVSGFLIALHEVLVRYLAAFFVILVRAVIRVGVRV